ncbi:MAG: hypothetical protein U1F77_00215 [Kiritimatiellia bacterium]
MARRPPKPPPANAPAPVRPAGRGWLLAGVLLVVPAVAGIYFATRDAAPRPKPQPQRVPGPADVCATMPPFALRMGLKPPIAIDLRGQGTAGFSLIGAGPNARPLRLPEWEAFGNLGAHTLDRDGNLYVAPIPFFRTGGRKTPPITNQFYIVDGQSGRMTEFTHLPMESPPSATNPFGVMGLAYDCGTKSLYACSVAGSGPRAEKGVIFQIDPKTRAILSRHEGVDALGLAVFNGARDRRLYFGSARRSEVRSIALDGQGGFTGPPRLEVSLANQVGGAFDKASSIKFHRDGRMEVKGLEFSFSLIVASDPLRNTYTFVYKPENDTWTFRDILRK